MIAKKINPKWFNLSILMDFCLKNQYQSLITIIFLEKYQFKFKEVISFLKTYISPCLCNLLTLVEKRFIIDSI